MRKLRYPFFTAALCCLLMLCTLAGPARAEDCFVLDVDGLDMSLLNNNDYVAQNLSARAQGLRVQKYISGDSELAQSVRLTILRMDTQTLLVDKDYGYQSGVFDSGVIYLTYGGTGVVPYLVTLYAGDTVYAMPFMQLQPRLEWNSACTYGVRLSDLGLSSDWLMGTMLDLDSLRASGGTTLDICASNAYVLGQAYVQMQNEALCVQLSLNPAANVELQGLSLYVITDCNSLTGDPAYLGLAGTAPGQWVDVGGAASAFLYMPMQVSYDPAGLNGFWYDVNDGYQQNQLALWNQNRNSQPAEEWTLPPQEGEASTVEPSEEPYADSEPSIVIEPAPWEETAPEATVPAQPVPDEQPLPQPLPTEQLPTEMVPDEASPEETPLPAEAIPEANG